MENTATKNDNLGGRLLLTLASRKAIARRLLASSMSSPKALRLWQEAHSAADKAQDDYNAWKGC